ncbi:hypothetical protein [Streptomyces sp. SAJ15]|nr:hypothetical protein [Streptomyces sp. SAJ15]
MAQVSQTPRTDFDRGTRRITGPGVLGPAGTRARAEPRHSTGTPTTP